MKDDTIRRSDAINAVSKVDDYGDGIGFEVRSHCLVELELVPSADRPQGEWVRAMDGYDMHVKCTSCFKTYDWDTQAQYYNFCPNCGCRMKGADDE